RLAMHRFRHFVNLMKMQTRRLIGFVSVIQLILLLVHFLLYETWVHGWTGAANAAEIGSLRLVTAILAVSFVGASLLAFRSSNAFVRSLYRIAAVWLGTVNFLFFAACLSWILLAVIALADLPVNAHRIVEILFSAAAALSLVAVMNASWPRIKHVGVRLEK